MLRTTILLLGLAMAAPVHAADAHGDQHVVELDGLRAIHAWTRATSAKTALVFVDIENGSGHDVELLGGEAAIAASVELVGFRLEGASPVYEVLPRLPVRAGSEIVLAPNGVALRLGGLSQSLEEGTEFELEIEFGHGSLEVHVAVEAPDAGHHGHAGHMH